MVENLLEGVSILSRPLSVRRPRVVEVRRLHHFLEGELQGWQRRRAEAILLYAAGLDVFAGEPFVNPRLLTAPRVTLLPHIGSATIGTRTRMARLACQGVADVLAGRTPPNAVTS